MKKIHLSLLAFSILCHAGTISGAKNAPQETFFHKCKKVMYDQYRIVAEHVYEHPCAGPNAVLIPAAMMYQGLCMLKNMNPVIRGVQAYNAVASGISSIPSIQEKLFDLILEHKGLISFATSASYYMFHLNWYALLRKLDTQKPSELLTQEERLEYEKIVKQEEVFQLLKKCAKSALLGAIAVNAPGQPILQDMPIFWKTVGGAIINSGITYYSGIEENQNIKRLKYILTNASSLLGVLTGCYGLVVGEGTLEKIDILDQSLKYSILGNIYASSIYPDTNGWLPDNFRGIAMQIYTSYLLSNWVSVLKKGAYKASEVFGNIANREFRDQWYDELCRTDPKCHGRKALGSQYTSTGLPLA